MKIYDFNTLPSNTGLGIFIYGPTGVGKTTSVLQTAPMPIFYLLPEGRDPGLFVSATKRKELQDPVNFRCSFYEGIEDLNEFFATKQKSLERFRTIIIDGLSELCSVLSSEIVEESWEARDKSKVVKSLTSQSKMTLEDYGVLSRLLMRATETVLKYVQAGKIVIFISLIDENPKYNRALAAAPLFMGKEYGKNFPGKFDLIGLVEARPIKEGREYADWERVVRGDGLVFPPLVSFNSPEATFMAKWTGQPVGGPKPLHIEKLFELSKKGITDWGSNHQEEERVIKQEKEVKAEEAKEEAKEETKNVSDDFD